MTAHRRRIVLGVSALIALLVGFLFWRGSTVLENPTASSPVPPVAVAPAALPAPPAASVTHAAPPQSSAPALAPLTPPGSVTNPPVGYSPAALTVAVAAVPTAATVATPTSVNEVAATARMYAAHAPLRVAEVADPDSEANRRILQTMVEKALVRAAVTGAERKSEGVPVSK